MGPPALRHAPRPGDEAEASPNGPRAAPSSRTLLGSRTRNEVWWDRCYTLGVSSDLTPTPEAAAVSGPASTSAPVSLEIADPAHYLNRELSWLEFNARVLAEAASAEVPL